MNSIKNKLKETGREITSLARGIGEAVKFGAAVSLVLLGPALVLNGACKVGQYGLEKVFEPYMEHKEIEATLEKKDYGMLLGTHGFLGYGVFNLGDGEEIVLHDSPYVSGGKYFENTEIPKLQEWKKYRMQIVGNETIGWTLLSSEPYK